MNHGESIRPAAALASIVESGSRWPTRLLLTLVLCVSSLAAMAATPTIFTNATPIVTLGQSISDTAMLAGGVNPTGTITFRLYGPNDSDCLGAVIFMSSVPLTGGGNGSYNSSPFTPAASGTYRWVARYNGDANNSAVTGACNAPNETSVVSPASTTTITTTATASAPLGSAISDVATLADGFNPTGTITFSLFGPNNASCLGGAVFTSIVPLTGAGNGNYNSGPFTPTAAGTYRWIASYSGDANNNPVIGACNAPNETSVVSANTPTLTTMATPSVMLDAAISDVATLSGAFNPTGSISFTLFGPGDVNCLGGPFFTSTVTVSGNGTYNSGAFTPTAAGTYRWIAGYSGDANNLAITALCNAPNEASVVTVPDDTVPENFAFMPQTNVAPGSVRTSNTVTITGINTATSISVTGGTYSVGCTAFFTSAMATIGNNQQVCVRHTAAAGPAASTSTILNVGGVSRTFTSTTAKGNTTLKTVPTAFVLVTTGLQIRIVLSPTARLTDGANAPIAGRLVSFTAGNVPLCVAVTNANGLAKCQASLANTLRGVLSLGYTARFAGDAMYNAATDKGAVIGLKLF